MVFYSTGIMSELWVLMAYHIIMVRLLCRLKVQGNKHPSCHPDTLEKVRLKQKIKETKGKCDVLLEGKINLFFIFWQLHWTL